MARYDVEQRCTRSGTVRIRAASPTVTSFPLSIWCHRLLRLPHFPLNRASGRVTVGLTHSRLTPPGLDALTSTLPCESLAGCSGLAGLDAQPSAYAVLEHITTREHERLTTSLLWRYGIGCQSRQYPPSAGLRRYARCGLKEHENSRLAGMSD